MSPNDVAALNQAVQLAQAGNKETAYQQLKQLSLTEANRSDVNLLLWLAFTSPHLEESEWAINSAVAIQPNNPHAASAWQWLETERYLRNKPPVAPEATLKIPETVARVAATTKGNSRQPVFLLVGACLLIVVAGIGLWVSGILPFATAPTNKATNQVQAVKPLTASVSPSSTMEQSRVTETPGSSVAVAAVTNTKNPDATSTPVSFATATPSASASLNVVNTPVPPTVTFSGSPPTPTPPFDVRSLPKALKEANDTALINGDFKNSVAKFEALIREYPDNAKIWRDFGFILFMRDHNESSIAPLEQAAKLDAKDPLTFFYLTSAYAYSYRTADAQKAQKMVIQLDPNGWLGQIALADQYINNFQFDMVATPITMAQKAAANSGVLNDPLYNYFISSPLFFVPNIQASEKAAAIVSSAWSKVPSIMLSKAITLFSRYKQDEKKVNEAADLITSADKLQPNNYLILSVAADFLYYARNDEGDAEKYAEDALKLREAIPTTHRLLGEIALNKKDYDGAFKHFERCIQLSKQMLDCYYSWSDGLITYAKELKKQGKDAEARQAMKKAQQTALEIYNLLPKVQNVYSGWSVDFNYLIGKASYYLEEFKTAITNFQKVIDFYPRTARYYGWVGLAYLEDGQEKKAREAYNKGYALDSSSSTIKVLGDALDGDSPSDGFDI